jgi:ribonuclease HI
LARGSHPTKGNYKQQLMRGEKVPTKEAKERVDNWLWDSEILRVFVDASEIKNSGIFGLGAIFVGQGTTILKSKKHYNQSMKRVNVYAEIAAIEFALMQLEKVVGAKFYLPLKVLIYSDWNAVDKLKDKTIMTNRISAINAIAEKINERRIQFLKAHPEIDLEIAYLGEEKKFNPFYISSHNAARQAIGI